MRRFGIALAVLLLVLFGAYTAFWFHVAGRIANGLGEWAEQARAQSLDVTWRAIGMAGYPFAFRAELHDARLRQTGNGPEAELRAPLLSGSTRPWSFRYWQLSAPDGISTAIGPQNAPAARLTAREAAGHVTVSGERAAKISLVLADPALEGGARLAAATAEIAISLPEQPPQKHTDPVFSAGLALRDLRLPEVPAPLRGAVDEIALGVTVRGPLLAGPPREAAAAWRDAGGTAELDNLSLRWGTLAVTGSGTLALDPDLQPEGAFSGAIEGYDELLAALTAAGKLRPGDAGLARLALSMMAKPGPSGKPRIATPFTIQNGEMRLGPVKLGKAPRIAWE